MRKPGGSYNKTTQHAFTTSFLGRRKKNTNQEVKLFDQDQETTIATTTTSRPHRSEQATKTTTSIRIDNQQPTSTTTKTSLVAVISSSSHRSRGRKKTSRVSREPWSVCGVCHQPLLPGARTRPRRLQHEEAEAGLIEHH